ncbi:MAG: hypothetical protein MUO21_01190 [Nitrososphaeraceae archaeon]|nr:hypothetical protein [Nitrososphaeraceae archaeon]
MVTGEVIHTFAAADYTKYSYHAIFLPSGVGATINGTVIPASTSSTLLPVGISSTINSSGSFFLIGRKNFGATSGNTASWENPLSNDPGNSTGTYSIK